MYFTFISLKLIHYSSQLTSCNEKLSAANTEATKVSKVGSPLSPLNNTAVAQ
jgi:hypothetical protein